MSHVFPSRSSSELKIFVFAFGTLPHVLSAVRILRERAGVDFDSLGQGESVPVAPGAKHALGDLEHEGVLDQGRCMGGMPEQAAEALGAPAVEIAIAEGGLREAN